MQTQNIELKKLALIDKLTDSYNRRGLDEVFKDLILKHINSELNLIENTDLSIIMSDIDHFKKVNDTYGHDIGDKILSEFTMVLKENVKKKDIISRYGGEEFIIILPNTEITSAFKLAENLRHSIENNKFYNEIKITSSFGVASLSEIVDYNNIDECINGLTKLADNRLYEAKKNGRNIVIYNNENKKG
jgi:diguanylate cyclase (GGDEF)-like protein